ncbi:MAG TPA: Clp1/GlmU family protein, partial [Methanomicrobiales archaeon]|nr:Clp1/GlmU family protein [Methanomicrobiales archaeon]
GREYLRFVGSTSPSGHLLQTLAAEKRLLEKALELKAKKVVIDSSGFVLGAVPEEFQFQTIDLLQPDHLVAIQRGEELEDLLDNFRRQERMRICRLSPSFAVVERSREERRAYREKIFTDYFGDARSIEVPLKSLGIHGKVPDPALPGHWRDLLLGLNNGENMLLSLAILEDYNPFARTIRVFSPPVEREDIATIEFGSYHLRRESIACGREEEST